MFMVNSTPKRSVRKPVKPYPDYPLFAHATGRWAKKIKGKLHYFGPWDKPDKAFEKYKAERDSLYKGVTPRLTPGEITIKTLCNSFLTAKKARVESGELAQRSWADYFITCERMVKYFGKNQSVSGIGPKDFEHFRASLAKLWGPTTLGNEIRRIRVVFNYAYKQDLIDRPVKFGEFKPPNKKTMRLERAKKCPRMFEPIELRKIIGAAGVQLKAMILLGVNCGFGNMDVATILIKTINLKTGWVDYPRPKTGIPRRCPLWSETVAALRNALKKRPKPKDIAFKGLAFITKYGSKWDKSSVIYSDSKKDKPKIKRENPISREFGKILRDLDYHKPGLGFYSLRHIFETIGGNAKDQIAVDAIMGHADDSMGNVYRERISDERLKAVVDHVHGWLFPKEEKK
jgi:integrase